MNRFTILITAVCSLIFTSTAFSAPARPAINERLLLIHAVPSAQTAEKEQAAQQSVLDGLTEILTDRGYRVVDKNAAEHCSLQIAATHDIDPFANKAAAFGLKYFAEYTVFYKTSTITKDNDSGTGALVRVSAKVVDTTSSQILTSRSAEASSSGLTLEDAIDKAGRASGKKLAGALISALEKISRESGGSHIYTIVVESRPRDNASAALLARLEQTPAISAVRESESGGGKTTFEVVYTGKRDQLDRDIIQAAGSLGWRLLKIRSEGNRSTWKVQ